MLPELQPWTPSSAVVVEATQVVNLEPVILQYRQPFRQAG